MLKTLRNPDFLIALILLVLLVAIRIIYLPQQKAWYDEIVSLTLSSQPVEKIINISAVDTNTPLYYIILHYYFRLVGNSEFTARLLSIFFGSLSGIFIYLAAKNLTKDKLFANVTLFLIAISPFHIWYSQEIRVYSLLILVSAASLYFLQKGLKSTSWTNAVCYTLLITLGSFLHLSFLFFLAALDLFLLFKVVKEKNPALLTKFLLLPNLVLLIVISLTFIGNLPVFAPQLINVLSVRQELSANANTTQAMNPETFPEDPLSTISRTYWGYTNFPTILVLTIILIGAGVYNLRRSKQYEKLYLLYILVLLTSIFISPRILTSCKYLSYAFPVIVILLTYPVSDFVKKLCSLFNKEILLKYVSLGVIIVACAGSSLFINIKSRESSACGEKVIETISNYDLASNVVLAGSASRDLQYYAPPSMEIKTANTNYDPQGAGLSFQQELRANWFPVVSKETVNNLVNYYRGYQNVWYTGTSISGDPHNLLLGYLLKNLELVETIPVKCSTVFPEGSAAVIHLFKNQAAL